MLRYIPAESGEPVRTLYLRAFINRSGCISCTLQAVLRAKDLHCRREALGLRVINLDHLHSQSKGGAVM